MFIGDPAYIRLLKTITKLKKNMIGYSNEESKELKKEINHYRVVVENVIGRIKKFHIL